MEDKVNHAAISRWTNCQGTGKNYRTGIIPIIFLLVILFFSAWIRFDRITKQGINPGDSFRYVREAKIWADGKPPTFEGLFYRPLSYFLQAAAIKIFGYTDYSTKILHGLMDMINIILIFLIAAGLAENAWVGVVNSLLYAFLPAVVKLTRSEMVHVEGTTFVLLAFYFFFLFDKHGKKGFKGYFLLFLSGMNSGLAANTHADLAFLAPGYVLYLFIKSYNSQNKKESLKTFVTFASIFSFSFFTPYLAGFLIFGFKKVFLVLISEFSVVTDYMKNISGSISPFQLFGEILIGSIKFFFGKPFLFISILLIGTIFIIIYRKVRKENDPLCMYLPLLLILSYVFLFSCFLNSFEIGYGRYFMALIPSLILTVSLWYYKIFKQFLGKFSLIGFTCLFLILFFINPKELPGKRKFKSPYREIYDILKNNVNSKNKLLLAPVSLYSLDRGYQLDLYFGKNAVYLCRLPFESEYNPESLNTRLNDMNIRYIFMGKQIDTRLLNHDSPVWRRYNPWFNNDRNPYSLKKDLRIIKTYIRSKGGLLVNANRFGKIYYLPGEEDAQ